MKKDIDIEMDAGAKMLEIRRRELKDNLSNRIKVYIWKPRKRNNVRTITGVLCLGGGFKMSPLTSSLCSYILWCVLIGFLIEGC